MNAGDATHVTSTEQPPGAALDAQPGGSGRSGFGELLRQWSVDAMHLAGTSPTERFDRITRLAQQVLGADQAAISFIDRDRQWFKSDTAGNGGTSIPRVESFCTHTIEQSDVYIVQDTREDALFRDNELIESAGIRFYAGQSLLGPGGERVGALCVFNKEPRAFTESQQQLLQDLAVWVQDELTLATEAAESNHVQQGLLPAPLVSLPGYQVAGINLPVRSVGGDFYDWYPVTGGAAFTVGGVMGRGMASAIIAATVRATMRASSRSNGASAAVETAAETLDADLSGAAAFVTLFHAHLEEQTGRLTYVDAGHGLSLIVHADGWDEHLDSSALPLGAGWDNFWEERSTVLRPGDVLVSVSDGVLDAFGGTLDSLARIATLVRRAPTVEAVVESIIGAASGRAGDDLTVIAVSRDPALRIAG